MRWGYSLHECVPGDPMLTHLLHRPTTFRRILAVPEIGVLASLIILAGVFFVFDSTFLDADISL